MGRFSAKLMEHYESPCNRGVMCEPDATGMASLFGNPPFVTIYLQVQNVRVTEAAFDAAGCGVTIGCASMLTELLRGRPLAECERFSADDLIRALDGLPPDKRHSADVVIAALHDALAGLSSRAADPAARSGTRPFN